MSGFFRQNYSPALARGPGTCGNRRRRSPFPPIIRPIVGRRELDVAPPSLAAIDASIYNFFLSSPARICPARRGHLESPASRGISLPAPLKRLHTPYFRSSLHRTHVHMIKLVARIATLEPCFLQSIAIRRDEEATRSSLKTATACSEPAAQQLSSRTHRGSCRPPDAVPSA